MKKTMGVGGFGWGRGCCATKKFTRLIGGMPWTTTGFGWALMRGGCKRLNANRRSVDASEERGGERVTLERERAGDEMNRRVSPPLSLSGLLSFSLERETDRQLHMGAHRIIGWSAGRRWKRPYNWINLRQVKALQIAL